MDGLHPRPQARQDGPARPGHLRTALRERAGAGRQRARQGGPRLLPPDARTCRRSGCRSRSRRSPAPAKPGGRHCNTPRTARHSASRSAASSTTGSCSPRWTPSSRSPSTTSTGACRRVVDGELTAVEAAKAKWWCTETAKKVIDGCVQLHGGYGYMNGVPRRPRLRRRPHPDDLRRHDRDHEGDHRPRLRPIAGSAGVGLADRGVRRRRGLSGGGLGGRSRRRRRRRLAGGRRGGCGADVPDGVIAVGGVLGSSTVSIR